MQATEFEATINSNGDIHVPERYHTLRREPKDR